MPKRPLSPNSVGTPEGPSSPKRTKQEDSAGHLLQCDSPHQMPFDRALSVRAMSEAVYFFVSPECGPNADPVYVEGKRQEMSDQLRKVTASDSTRTHT